MVSMKKSIILIIFASLFACKNQPNTVTTTDSYEINEYDSLLTVAQLLMTTGMTNSAFNLFDSCYKINSSRKEGQYGIGVCYLLQEEINSDFLDSAEQYLSKVFLLDQKYRSVCYNLAVISYKAKKFTNANKYIDLHIQYNKTDPYGYLHKAYILLQDSGNNLVCDQINKAIKYGIPLEMVSEFHTECDL